MANTPETIDIVELIEQNPIVRLTNTYKSKLIEKIKTIFNESDQHLFVSSFYCYLNYDTKKDFVIDLDNVWKWLGFNNKANAKIVLEKNFTPEIDYRSLLLNSQEQKKNGRGGHNRQTVLMTIKTFKLLCLKAGTKKAEQIHEYYINLEETLQEAINEESNELRLQLEQKNKQIEEQNIKIEKTKKEKELLREATILEQFPINTECVYYGLIDDTNDEQERLVKFGQSNDLNKRVKQHKKTFTNFRLVNAFKVDNKQLIENAIKTNSVLNKFRRSLIVNGINQTELLAINELTMTELCRNIHNIIYSNEITAENFMKVLEEQRFLKTDNLLLKGENERLKIENKKLLKNYKIKTVSKMETFTLPVQNEEVTTEGEVANSINEIIYNQHMSQLKRIAKRKDGFFHINGKKYEKLYGSREEVWNETAYRTRGELVKTELILNKEGKIVSKKKHISSKEFNRLQNVIDEKIKNAKNNIITTSIQPTIENLTFTL